MPRKNRDPALILVLALLVGLVGQVAVARNMGCHWFQRPPFVQARAGRSKASGAGQMPMSCRGMIGTSCVSHLLGTFAEVSSSYERTLLVLGTSARSPGDLDGEER